MADKLAFGPFLFAIIILLTDFPNSTLGNKGNERDAEIYGHGILLFH